MRQRGVGAEVSGELGGVLKGEASVKGYTDGSKETVETEIGIKTKSTMPAPSEETSVGEGIVFTINFKEIKRAASDFIDFTKKYVKEEVDRLNNVRKGKHEKN